MRRAARLAFVALLTTATATPHSLELPYDGRLTFVRLRWAGGNLSSRGSSAAWNHDYPRAEQHLAQILLKGGFAVFGPINPVVSAFRRTVAGSRSG